jgi:hypothetical protein
MVVCDKNAELVDYARKRLLRTLWYRCKVTGLKLGHFPVGLDADTHVINELAYRNLPLPIVRIYM